jgi:acetyl esterase/lipase
MMMQSRRSQLIRAFLLLLVSSYAAASEFRGYDNTQHLIAGDKERGEKENIWYHPSRMLNPSTTCPWPDDITSLSNVRSGQYGSEKGDCFYMYWDPNVGCDIANGNNNTCPLFIYVDGTGHAANIDDRDSFYMVEMAQRGYVAVTVDYGKN